MMIYGVSKLLRRFAKQFMKINTPKDLELSDFDSDFYFEFYSDLFHLKSPMALKKHYRLHGRKEGRFKNWGEARNNFEQRFGTLPADFTVEEYRVLNPDLAFIFNFDWQFVFHYLEHGRREGRLYHPSEDSKRPWADLFRLADFVACAHDWLEEPILTKQQAIQIFASRGIERLAPFNLEYIFDPVFYRSAYEFDGNISDVELYRHWLKIGVLKGLFPNEERSLQNLVADRQYPTCFDWREYRLHASFPKKSGIRLDALTHLFERGFEAGLTRQIKGKGADKLFAAIGDYHLIRGHHRLSIAAYDRAIEAGDTDAGVFHRRGDAHAAVGNSAAAQSNFLRAASNPGASIWSHIHAARVAAGKGAFDKAFNILLEARPKWIKNAEYRTTVNDVIELFFASKSNAAMALHDTGARDGADKLMIDALDEIRMRIAQLEGLPGALPRALDGHVAILANQDLVQCNHYRVEQKVRQLKRAGISATLVNQNNPADFIGSLLGARAAIFYRTPAFPGIMRAIMTANALGIPTYYEIDDLIFDNRYPDAFESYEGQISRADYRGLLYGVPLFRYAMALCERGITTTTPLAKEMERVVKGGDCLVLRNGLDERNENAILMGSAPRPDRDVVTIFYGSGTKAHNSDFNELVGPALLFALEHHDNVNLVIVGHLKLRPEFDRYSSRIKTFGFVPDLDRYWSLLAACDINLAVLSPGPMADCKSEIKWLEAAILQVPSVVSGTATYREALKDGVDAFIADNESDWAKALRRLIVDRDLRRRIGASARAKALHHYSLDSGANCLSLELGQLTGLLTSQDASSGEAKSRGAVAGKIKVLVCNVFFPPQTYGGATRVVKDNVDFIRDHCADIDVSVFTTDEGISPPGRLRFDRYGEIPVFRLSTPAEVNMDWRPFNADNEEIFSRVLDSLRPNLVHFHCIQRLTASIVEVALRRNIPYVVTVHDGWWVSDHQFFVDGDGVLRLPSTDAFVAVPPSGISLTDSVARRERLAGLLQGAAHVISVSGAFANIYRAVGCRNVTAIPNGVSMMAPAVRKRDADARLSLGHVGGRTAHKGATLIEAVLRTTNFNHLRLTMVDMTMEPDARRQTIWGNTPVLLRGPCPQHEVMELYASLDVLLAPSIWPESFGLVAREAKAQGLWVIASDRGAMGDGVLEGENGFVIDVTDGRALTAILGTLDADVARFKNAAPQDNAPMRTAADQGREIVALYRKIAAHAPLSDSMTQEETAVK
jgi:glycosyltransferase involved in cell wall biosynthesis